VTVVGAAAIPCVAPVISLLPYEPAVALHMTDYLTIRLLALGAIVGTEVLGNWYGGLGNTRLHMVAGVIAMVLNVGLNWLLIEGNLGAPALGVRGAAIASVIASWIGFGFLLYVFVRKKYIPGVVSARLRLVRAEFWRMLRFGIPNGLNWFLEFAAFALFLNVFVAHLGTATLAAMMVVININSVSFMPAFGLASSGAILAGQAIGAGDKDAVPGIVKMTAAVNLCWMGIIGCFYMAIPGVLMGWFARDNDASADLLELGTVMLAVSAAWQLFDAVAMTLSETLRAAGDTTWCMWARLIVGWVVFTPAAAVALLVLDGGHVAAMLCLVGYLGLLAVLFVWRFSAGAWRDIDLTGSSELEM